MKSNMHKKMTFEDKFGRRYYCQHAKKFIKHQKRANNKQFRRILKVSIRKQGESNYE